MSDIIITVDKLSKRYKLGEIGATSLRESVERAGQRIKNYFTTKGTKFTKDVGKEKSSLSGLSVLSGEKSVSSPSSPAVPDMSRRSARTEAETQSLSVSSVSSVRDNSSDLWALRDVSFEVKRGEVLGIIGRNGAGKSTLLKILSRITEPTSGRAIMRGRVGSLLEVGTGFHPELSGRENIFLNGAILGMKKAEIASKFDEIVAFAEVEKFIDTPVKRYSSGMYVRLAFAVAAHLDPEILIVDEVLAVGDAAFQKKCLGKMSDISQKEGRTVLFVSHNMGAVRLLCNTCLIIKQGKASYSESVKNSIDNYICDLSEIKRENPANMLLSSSMVIVDFMINGSSSESQYALVHWKEDIEIMIIIKSTISIRNAILGLAIKNMEDQVLLISHSDQEDGNMRNGCSIQEGKSTITCKLKNNLPPGKYKTAIAITDSQSVGIVNYYEYNGPVMEVGESNKEGLKKRVTSRAIINSYAEWKYILEGE